ncbi:type IV pilus assembly protein PilW [Noviherbaspirillum suwonense]|uniref:Type IV pilus assembly protein PilW n=1 Tax=Noviherbaspirillum suwonense TaxID=1224511 RepID=A0ABY1PQS1_9BURK|nr:type IV pilus assembly protein PilW [Noviherbaspirillum suwonense]
MPQPTSMSPRPGLPTRRAGFGLAELMVGLSLGLLTLLAMSQAYIAFHFQHRDTDSGIGAQTSAMNALYAIERDVLQAGQGMADRRLLGCDARRDAGGSLLLAPAQIVAGGQGGPDTLHLLLGDSRAAPARLAAGLAPGSATIAVGSTLGMRPGDFLALQQAGRPCALLRVGGVTSALQASRVAENGAAAPGNADAVGDSAYSSEAIVVNLGRLERVTYAISGTLLQRTRTVYPGAAPTTENIASNIVSLKLQYGFDTRPGAQARLQVDTWSETMLDADRSGASGDRGDWQRMGGLRLAVVARSPFRQAPGVGGACATTVEGAANAPGWQAMQADGATGRSPISLAHLPDWKCYRYRVAETAVPIRNVVWGAP